MVAAPIALLGSASAAQAGNSDYIGEVSLAGYNYCPVGTAEAAGQFVSIASNTALFALLGTTYGGNGQTTFALPDLRGRVAIGTGQGPGLSPLSLGQTGGTENVTLLTVNLPTHSHTAELRGENSVLADKANPNNATLALASAQIYSKTNAPNPAVTLAAGSVVLASSGSSTGFALRDPYLGMLYCIADEGIFPSRP